MSCCRNVTTVAAMMIKFDRIFTCHKSANPKSDHKPTTYPTKYLRRKFAGLAELRGGWPIETRFSASLNLELSLTKTKKELHTGDTH
jgi:hypothetical protein